MGAVRAVVIPAVSKKRPFCEPKTRAFDELLIDCEEERTLRAVLVGMLWEERGYPLSGNGGARGLYTSPLTSRRVVRTASPLRSGQLATGPWAMGSMA
jgi:hypothetical protein